MNVLILGSDGRAHALANTYAKSKRINHIFIAPGNGLIGYQQKNITTLDDIQATDLKKILAFVKINNIDLVDVAPDPQLASGYVDALQKENIWAFGPTKKAAEIEWNKAWARDFMQKYHLPVPLYQIFTNTKKAEGFLKKVPEQSLYIKASGLAAGKGVIFAPTKKDALQAIEEMKNFGTAGEVFLIEECMIGEEFSLFALCDGKTAKVISFAQDHKTVYNGNQGPNTGGMGCVAPTTALNTKKLHEIDKTILLPFMQAMIDEDRPYVGVLYLGGMITKKGIKIIEFNARWGDPEAEVILPGLQSDYVDLITAVKQQRLDKVIIKTDNKVRVSITGCAKGYPGSYAHVAGKKIFGIENVLKYKSSMVFGAGVEKKGKGFFVNGGRVIHIVGEGNDILQARQNAYGAMALLHIPDNNLHYRTDIGWQDVKRVYEK